MNKLGLLFFATAILFAMELHAQKKVNWFGTVQQGISHDNKKINVQPVLTGGAEWNNWSAGLSFSADFFYARSLQAGLDLRRYVNIAKQELFVYAVPGVNMVIPSKEEKGGNFPWNPRKNFDGGYYLESGAGIMIGKKKNFFAALAWSRKTFTEKYDDIIYNPVTQKTETLSREFDFEYNRIGMKLGVVF